MNKYSYLDDWDTHFLIRCLKGMGDRVNSSMLITCIQHLVGSWSNTGHCICHLLERCLRLVSIEVEILNEYITQHSHCRSDFYYKMLYTSLSSCNQHLIRDQLDSHPVINNPYYLQVYFKLSEVEGHKNLIPFLVEENLALFLTILAEKDTMFITVLSSMAGYSLIQNTPIALHFFYLFLERYDYDMDMILSMLNESAEILFALSRICKVMSKYKTFPFLSDLVAFFSRLRELFEVIEHRGLFDFSIAPLIRRISSVVPLDVC